MLSVNTMHVPRTLACSAGPDFDPVMSADVIVEGRFLGYEVLPDAPLPGTEGIDPKTGKTNDGTTDGHVPVRIDMAVERVWKGEVSTGTIAIIDPRTLSPVLPGHTEHEWIGASGACGAFDEDPTGVERMRAFPAAATLPALGSQSSVASFEWLAPTLAAVGLAVFGIGLLGAATLLVRPRRIP